MSQRSEVLVVSKVNDVFVGTGQDWETNRDDALEVAGGVSLVNNDMTAELAAEALRSLKFIRTETESSRKRVKEPVLRLGQDIDAKAKDFLKDVVREEERINRLLAEHQHRLRKEAEERERKAREEAQRLERERAAALRAADMARTAEDRKANIEKASELLQTKQQTLSIATAPPPKPEGVAATAFWDYEIQDAAEAFKNRPDFFELVPKRRVILDSLAAGNRHVPGLRIFETTKVRVA